MLKELMIFCLILVMKRRAESAMLEHQYDIITLHSSFSDVLVVTSNDLAVVKFNVGERKDEKLVLFELADNTWTEVEKMALSSKVKFSSQLSLYNNKLVAVVDGKTQVYTIEENKVKSGPQHLLAGVLENSVPVLYKNDLFIHDIDSKSILYYQLEQNGTAVLIQTIKPSAGYVFESGLAMFNGTALISARKIVKSIVSKHVEVLEYSLVNDKWIRCRNFPNLLKDVNYGRLVALSGIDGIPYAMVASINTLYLFKRVHSTWTLKDHVIITDGDICSIAVSDKNVLVVVRKGGNFVIQFYSILSN